MHSRSILCILGTIPFFICMYVCMYVRILARMSVSVSASWNAVFTERDPSTGACAGQAQCVELYGKGQTDRRTDRSVAKCTPPTVNGDIINFRKGY